MTKKIGIIVGSLRKESLNRKMAEAISSLAPKTLVMSIIPIGDLQLYNQDLDDENRPPATWTKFRDEVKECDGILFISPEYNRSVSGALKNALDVGSRPYGESVWENKPCAIITVSPGAIGGFGANHHLRQSLVFLDMPCLQQPEAYIGHADKLFDDKGQLINEDTQKFLTKFLETYTAWVTKLG